MFVIVYVSVGVCVCESVGGKVGLCVIVYVRVTVYASMCESECV